MELSQKENVDISTRRVLHMRTLDLELRTSAGGLRSVGSGHLREMKVESKC